MSTDWWIITKHVVCRHVDSLAVVWQNHPLTPQKETLGVEHSQQALAST
jgi:hypothetical protein